MSDMEAAEKRLEHAIVRLESALESVLAARARTDSAARADISQTGDGETIRDVTVRIDSAIHNLRRVLEE